MDRFFCKYIPLLLALYACDSSPRLVEQGEAVIVYSNILTSSDQYLFTAYEKSSGVKVNIVHENGARIISRLSQADSMPADLLILNGLQYLQEAKQAGLLDTLSASSLFSAIPAHLKDNSRQWLGLAYSADAIAYLKDSVDTLQIQQYEALTDIKWQSKLSLGLKRETLHTHLATMIAIQNTQNAEDWLFSLKQNLADSSRQGLPKFTALNDSSAWLALVNTAEYAASSSRKTALLFPLGGAYLHLSAAGITKEAPHASRARTLLSYLFSRDVMRNFAEAYYLYPARTDVPSPQSLNRLGILKADSSAQSRIATYLTEAERLLELNGW